MGVCRLVVVLVEETGSEFHVLDKTGESMNEHNRDLAKLIDDYSFERAFRQLTDE